MTDYNPQLIASLIQQAKLLGICPVWFGTYPYLFRQGFIFDGLTSWLNVHDVEYGTVMSWEEWTSIRSQAIELKLAIESVR